MPKPRYIQCPACAERIRAEAKICRFCGAALTDGPLPDFVPEYDRELDQQLNASVEEQFSIMGLQLSKGQRHRILDFLKHSGEEYRLASSMFVDICRFTRICERLKGEQIKDLLDVFYLIFTQVVDFYNGTIVQIAGDGGVAFFGAPVAADRDAEAAVRAAVELRDRVQALPAIHGVRFNVAIGIATGEVLSSIVWNQTPPIYKVYGSSVNLAARIEGVTPPGRIRIDPETHELLRGTFSTRKLPPRKFKNIREPVTTFEIQELRKTLPPRRDYSIPWVGRTRELDLLENLWSRFMMRPRDSPRESTCMGVVLSGEAGIGKTRLMLEFARKRQREAHVLRIDSEPFSAKVPLGFWRRVLEDLLGIKAKQSRESVREQLRRSLDALEFPKEKRATLQAVLGLPEGLKAGEGLSPRSLIRLLRSDLETLLTRASVEKPILVLADDLHWADPSSLRVLNDILRSAAPGNIFYLLAHRSHEEREPDFPSWLPRLPLGPLSDEDQKSMYNLLTDVREFYPEVRSVLLERSEGNPFYLVELIQTLQKNFAQLPAIKRKRLLPTTVREWLPSSLKELVQARIDQLDHQRKLVLQCGSVLGRRFAVQILEFYDFIREGLLAKLYSLKALEFLDDELTPEGLDYLFRHHLTHEVSYSSLPERQRHEFHRIIGERIEEKFAPDLEDFYPLLAYHFSRSGLEDRAVDYLYKAGYRAARLGAVEEAFENLGEALLRVRRLSPTVTRKRKELDISIELTRLHRLTGDAEAARTICKRALKLATTVRAARETARLQTELGLLELLASRPAEARHHLKEAMARARRLGRDSLVGMIFNGLGICEFESGNLKRAGELFGRTASLGLERSKPRLAADAANNLAMVAWKQADLQVALRRFRSARRLFERAHDRFGTAGTLMNIGIMEESLGRFAASEAHYRESLELARDIRFPQVIAAALANLASLALLQERFRDAQEFAAQSATIADSLGDQRAAAIALENLALAAMGMGAWRDARSHLRKARAIATRVRDKERLLSIDLSELEEMLLRGRIRKAMNRMGSLRPVVRRHAFPNEMLRFLRLQAWGYAKAGDTKRAHHAREEASRQARKQSNRAEEKRIRRLPDPGASGR